MDFLAEMEIFVQNQNFSQKSKCSFNICGENEEFPNFGQKSKFWQKWKILTKMENFAHNGNFRQKSKF